MDAFPCIEFSLSQAFERKYGALHPARMVAPTEFYFTMHTTLGIVMAYKIWPYFLNGRTKYVTDPMSNHKNPSSVCGRGV